MSPTEQPGALLLRRAGVERSVLVFEGTPWQDGGEPADRVLTGWAAALAVGAPAGEDEAMRTLASRFGLDPVFDMQSLEELTPGRRARAAARAARRPRASLRSA